MCAEGFLWSTAVADWLKYGLLLSQTRSDNIYQVLDKEQMLETSKLTSAEMHNHSGNKTPTYGLSQSSTATICFVLFFFIRPGLVISILSIVFQPDILVIPCPLQLILSTCHTFDLKSSLPFPSSTLQLPWCSKGILYSAHLSRSAPTPRTLFLCHPLTSTTRAKDIIYSLAPGPLQCVITEFLYIVTIWRIHAQTANPPHSSLQHVSHSDDTQKKCFGSRANCNHSFVPHGRCLMHLLHGSVNGQLVESMSHTLVNHTPRAFSTRVWHMYIVCGFGCIRVEVRSNGESSLRLFETPL